MKAEETVDYHIKSSWHCISRMYNAIAAEYGFTQAAGYALMSIDDTEGVEATKIGPLMGIEPTAVSRLLKSLENEGLIQRKKQKDDGRKVLIKLTPEGREKKKLAKKVVRSFNERVLDQISEKEFVTFRAVTEKILVLAEAFKEEKVISNK